MLHGGSSGRMATNIPIIPPEKFDFKKPDEWLKWKCGFQHFLSASGLDKDKAGQVSTLLYCLGDEAHDVLTSMSISDTDRKKYAKSWRNSTHTSMSGRK